jgi:hypothetical protein
MEALIIQTGTPPGQDGIALWVTMKNSMDIQYKINGWKRSYYRFPKDPKQASVWMKMIRRDHWEPKNHDRICSDHFEGGISIF